VAEAVLVKVRQFPVIRLTDMPLVPLTLAVEVEADTFYLRQQRLKVVLE
tara:strand:+ start:480 stop:626 length:147 start_codon:yes stop_codon:yes gene_type:complete